MRTIPNKGIESHFSMEKSKTRGRELGAIALLSALSNCSDLSLVEDACIGKQWRHFSMEK
jgi:hypothetical protein